MLNELLMDVCEGFEYSVTLQLRTPLVVLMKDGERVADKVPPDNPFDQMHGLWIPVAKSWRSMGIDMDEMSEGLVSSDAGPVQRAPYRNFLISLKVIQCDCDRTIGERIDAVKAVLRMPEHSGYSRKLGGQTVITDRLFPKVVYSVPGINKTVKEALWKARLRTVSKIANTDDVKLLALDGVGRKALASIREFCTGYAGDPDAERFNGAE